MRSEIILGAINVVASLGNAVLAWRIRRRLRDMTHVEVSGEPALIITDAERAEIDAYVTGLVERQERTAPTRQEPAGGGRD